MRPQHTPSSNRNFGFLFAIVFTLISAYTASYSHNNFKAYSYLAVSFAFGLVAVSSPDLLAPLNRGWMRLGELMGKVVSPLVLGLIFFTLITPTALISRLFGRDELRLKRSNTNTYWIDRVPPGPDGNSFKNQF